MKFSKITKSLVAGSVLAGASLSANAGVVATSYLDVQSFGIVAYYDAALTEEVAPQDLATFITITGGLRSASSSTGFNGVGLPDSPVFADDATSFVLAENTADGVFDCTGPSCGVLGVSNNSLVGNYAGALAVHNDSLANGYGYGMADSIVSGNALADPTSQASGLTYAAASVGSNNNVASGNSDIADALTTALEISVQNVSELYLGFVATYSLIVDASQSIGSGQVSNATTSAILSVGLGTDSSNGTGGALGFNFGGGYVDIGPTLLSRNLVNEGDDFSGSDTGVFVSTGTSDSGFFRVGTGDYQVDIKQESTARVSLVSAPGTLAIAGLGLLGLAAARRRKS
jgi:hypothetical protein